MKGLAKILVVVLLGLLACASVSAEKGNFNGAEISINEYSIGDNDVSADLKKAFARELSFEEPANAKKTIQVTVLDVKRTKSPGFLTASDSYRYAITAKAMITDVAQGKPREKTFKCATTMEEEDSAYRKTVMKVVKEIIEYSKE